MVLELLVLMFELVVVCVARSFDQPRRNKKVAKPKVRTKRTNRSSVLSCKRGEIFAHYLSKRYK